MTIEEKKALVKDIKGVRVDARSGMFNGSINITYFRTSKLVLLGSYADHKQAIEVRIIVEKVKKDMRRGIRPRHIQDAANEYRKTIGLKKLKTWNR